METNHPKLICYGLYTGGKMHNLISYNNLSMDAVNNGGKRGRS